ncbi:hypothetical protein BLNAU_5820 [Blattamonas nauphoetae]|uniref:Uncharacterized protein n=1 Tax=Blattamonas nauphoetae TaxID=2049346 RepID=A0ABQ9Y668_9EUKA|nr:hypothetical protein BLNAU_5820 [Blattamonas nauphoetae]
MTSRERGEEKEEEETKQDEEEQKIENEDEHKTENDEQNKEDDQTTGETSRPDEAEMFSSTDSFCSMVFSFHFHCRQLDKDLNQRRKWESANVIRHIRFS